MQKHSSPYVAGISPEAATLIDGFKAEALRRAAQSGLIGLGTGAAAGLTLTGLASLLSRRRKDPSDTLEVSVPYPQFVRKKKADLAEDLVAKVMPTPVGAEAPTMLSPRWLRDGGLNNLSVSGIPWAIPATVAAGAAGLFGGHQLARWALHRKYKHDLKRQLDSAKKEYDEAMLSQYDRSKIQPLLRKEAEHETTLDTIFHAIKSSSLLGLPSFDQLAGNVAGLGMTGAGAITLGTAAGTAALVRALSKNKAMQDALRRRAIIRDMQHPAPVYLRSSPVNIDDKDGEDPKKKK
jgi:hypothetical protein